MNGFYVNKLVTTSISIINRSPPAVAGWPHIPTEVALTCISFWRRRDINSANLQTLIRPPKVYSRRDVLEKDSPVPRKPGLYAWFFKEIPPRVILENCVTLDELTLLYVGISPKAPPRGGGRPSRQTLWHRVRYHYRGNAEGSTLRLTLGCLLSKRLGIKLRRVGSGKRMTFTHQGEEKLSQWMDQHALVSWLENPAPWVVEEQLIRSLSLPLNLQGNEHHSFHPVLSAIRAQAKASARELPVVPG